MRRINNKQDLANRITESVLKEMGLKHSSRRRALKENREQEILDKVHSMRSNIFDMTEEGYGVLYIDYDPQTNELYAGGATNAGIIKEYTVDYDDSQSLDYNLEGLYDEILQSPPTDDTMAENKKRIRKIVSEALRKEVINELDWKTYMNAAKKAYDSAENDDEEDRAWKFADAAEDAFNKDYGHIEPDDNLEYYGQKANQDVSGANFTPRGQYGVGMGSWTPSYAKMHSVRNIGRGETNNTLINPNSKMKPSKNTIDAYQRAENEMEKYANGKYKYKKGEGWQNESIYRKIDKIVSECLKRNIR